MSDVTKEMRAAGAEVIDRWVKEPWPLFPVDRHRHAEEVFEAMTAAQDSAEWWCPKCEHGVDRGWNGDQKCEDCGGSPVRLTHAQDSDDGSIVDLLEDALSYPCECGTPTGEMSGCRHCSLTTTAYGKIRRLEAAAQDTSKCNREHEGTCQYAVDVSMENHQCPQGKCYYAQDSEPEIMTQAEASVFNAQYRDWFDQLIGAVESKYEGETRFDTALRYIREAEQSEGPAAVQVDREEPNGDYVKVFHIEGAPPFISGYFLNVPFNCIEEIETDFIGDEEEGSYLDVPIGESIYLVSYNSAQTDHEGRTEIPAWWEFTLFHTAPILSTEDKGE